MAKQQSELKLIQDTAAIILIGIGLLLILALISYEPKDIGFFYADVNEPAVNYIGRIGAYVACALFFLIGLTSFILPTVMIFGGIILMIMPKFDIKLKPLWLLLLLTSGAGLTQLAKPFVDIFVSQFEPGGALGWAMIDFSLEPALGKVGAGIVMGVIYLSSLILLFEIHPVRLTKITFKALAQWYKAREKARFEAADPHERLLLEKKLLEKQERALKKKLSKKGLKFEDKSASLASPNRSNDSKEDQEIFDDQTFDKQQEEHEKTLSDSVLQEQQDEKLKRKSAARFLSTAKSSKEDKKEEMPQVSLLPKYDNYELPSLKILQTSEKAGHSKNDAKILDENMEIVVDTLKEFGIEVEPGDITKGATITRYEVYPAPGIRVERISNLGKNLARALKAERINILAPIPGKDTVGIEVGNTKKIKVVLRELFESDTWKGSRARLPLALGKDVYGKVLVTDLAEMPHLLIAGSRFR